MFKRDKERIQACLEYKDYCSAMEYANLIKVKYKNEKREYFEDIIKHIKLGNYKILCENNKRKKKGISFAIFLDKHK